MAVPGQAFMNATNTVGAGRTSALAMHRSVQRYAAGSTAAYCADRIVPALGEHSVDRQCRYGRLLENLEATVSRTQADPGCAARL